jgi:putative ABC transport system ATP-binding protein
MTRVQKTLLEARKVVHEFGQGPLKVRALRGINLTLNQGELTLLMGPSGSGKTTLLSILGCILRPSAGMVIVAGKETTGMSPEQLAAFRREHVGFIFQAYNLFPTLSAEENVKVALDIRGVRGPQAGVLAHRALCRVGLRDRERSLPSTLSGGEQQRLAVARALVGSPSVMLADEPTAALDSVNSLIVMDLLKELAQSDHRAVLAVTHDPRTVPFADRVLSIEDGMIKDEQRRVQGIDTVNDLSIRRRKTMSQAAPPSEVPPPTVGPGCDRQLSLQFVISTVTKYVPDAQSPILLSDVVKARLAQRAASAADYRITAREDILGILADWDNPDNALASQSDECIHSLAALFGETRNH